MKTSDLKKAGVAPDFNVLYSFCMDGAIGFEFEDYFIQLWPEIMCFTVEHRDRQIPRERLNGKILSWDAENAVIDYDTANQLSYLGVNLCQRQYPHLGERLVYMMGYLHVKSFSYERKYENPFA